MRWGRSLLPLRAAGRAVAANPGGGTGPTWVSGSRVIRLILILLWVALPGAVFSAVLAPDPGTGTRPAAFANPLMPGADPHALLVDKTMWVYPTESGGPGGRFFAYSSTDVRHWHRQGPVLDFRDVRWIPDDGQPRHGAWAPAVVECRGNFYFYYSAGPQNPTPSRIGVAVADGPAGPFVDSGRPLLTGGAGFEAIDPMVFRDPHSDIAYFYAGGSAGAKLRVFELNRDMISFAREVPVSTPPAFTEGVFMHYRQGIYYLSYSHGGFRDSSYSVHYATAPSPTGPWTYRGPILTSDVTRKGPGHHAFAQSPLDGEWLIFYHRWENQQGDGPYHGSRQVCVDRVVFDPAGLIQPIQMTSDPSPRGRVPRSASGE